MITMMSSYDMSPYKDIYMVVYYIPHMMYGFLRIFLSCWIYEYVIVLSVSLLSF